MPHARSRPVYFTHEPQEGFSCGADLATSVEKRGEVPVHLKTVLGALAAMALLASCGIGNSIGNSASSAGSSASAGSSGSASSFGGRLFNRRQAVEQQADPALRADGRRLISTVKFARFERARGGGIIRAQGIAPRQGYFNAALVSTTDLKPDENGVLTLEFRAEAPAFSTLTSTERSRQVNVALFISNQKLAAARSIRVVGRQNQINLRR